MSDDEDRGFDAILLLQRDHRILATLVYRAETNPEVLDELRSELSAHAALEDEIFYPAVREAMPESERVIVDNGLSSHADVRNTLDWICALSPRSDAFRQLLSDLRYSLERHVAEEEDLFESARKSVGPDTLADLGRRMQRRQEALQHAVHV